MPAAMFDEGFLSRSEDLGEVILVRSHRLYFKVSEQEPEHRFDADPAGRHVQMPTYGISGHVKVRAVRADSRVPVPADQLLASGIEKMIAVGDRADMPARRGVFDYAELVPEKKLDGADARGVQRHRVRRQGESLCLTGSLVRHEDLGIGDA